MDADPAVAPLRGGCAPLAAAPREPNDGSSGVDGTDGAESGGRSLRAAFVMEQTLGHVTHFRNLYEAAGQVAVTPTWLPIPFDVRGPARLVPLLGSNWSVRASWRARRALDTALAARPHDAVFFHTQVTALFSLSIMRRLPAIVSLDATPVNYDSVGRYYHHQPAGEGLLDRQKYALNRRVFHAAAALVSWSDWARRSLVDDYGVEPERVRVIAPGAAPAYFDVGRRRLASEEPRRGGSRSGGQDGENGGGPVRLLFVGADLRRKGGELLLECMRGALAERCELHLVTQADPPPQRGVCVHRGLSPNSPELLRLFAEADAFVFPSLADCLPVALMEAAAAGLPAIAGEVGAVGEAVLPGRSGLLVRPGDGRGLRRAMETLVDDAALRRRMGREGHALALRKFDARRNTRALFDLVAEVVAGAESRPPAARGAAGGPRRIA
jgi:glycosyltransferase involved in cell wall biosynthesis